MAIRVSSRTNRHPSSSPSQLFRPFLLLRTKRKSYLYAWVPGPQSKWPISTQTCLAVGAILCIDTRSLPESHDTRSFAMRRAEPHFLGLGNSIHCTNLDSGFTHRNLPHQLRAISCARPCVLGMFSSSRDLNFRTQSQLDLESGR